MTSALSHCLAVGAVIATSANASVAPAANPWPPDRYMHGGAESCRPVTLDSELGSNHFIRPYVEAARDAGWQIQECTYDFHLNPAVVGDPEARDDILEGWVVLADPAIATVESWIEGACERGSSEDSIGCIAALRDHVSGQSGAQFPVIGFVAEGGPGDSLCVQYGVATVRQGLIAFQDGVTVQRAQDRHGRREAVYCSTDGWGADIQQLISLSRPIFESYQVGRLAGLRETCGLDLITPDLQRQADREGLPVWLITVRENHLHAIRTGVDRMLERQAERFSRHEDLEGGCEISD